MQKVIEQYLEGMDEWQLTATRLFLKDEQGVQGLADAIKSTTDLLIIAGVTDDPVEWTANLAIFKGLLKSYALYQAVAALHFSSQSDASKDLISVDEAIFNKRVEQMVKACNDTVSKIV